MRGKSSSHVWDWLAWLFNILWAMFAGISQFTVRFSVNSSFSGMVHLFLAVPGIPKPRFPHLPFLQFSRIGVVVKEMNGKFSCFSECIPSLIFSFPWAYSFWIHVLPPVMFDSLPWCLVPKVPLVVAVYSKIHCFWAYRTTTTFSDLLSHLLLISFLASEVL